MGWTSWEKPHMHSKNNSTEEGPMQFQTHNPLNAVAYLMNK